MWYLSTRLFAVLCTQVHFYDVLVPKASDLNVLRYNQCTELLKKSEIITHNKYS